MLHAKKTTISSSRLGLWLVCALTLPFTVNVIEVLSSFICTNITHYNTSFLSVGIIEKSLHTTVTYKNSVNLVCHGRNPIIILKLPNLSARSGSGMQQVAVKMKN